MRVLANREGLLSAFAIVSAIVPARSPKPILANLKLECDLSEGTTLLATDLEVSVRHRVLGMKVDAPGAVILPTARVGQIFRTSGDAELAIEAADDKLTVRGLRSEFKLPGENPDHYPVIPGFDATRYHAVKASDLRRLIRRTITCTDQESTRYALGGVLVELTPDGMTFVGTDGRRLALMTTPARAESEDGGEGGADAAGMPVIPVKALKLIERVLDDDDLDVHLAFTSGAVLVRTERAVIHSRLVEGRFPRYRDVFPAEPAARIPLVAGTLRRAVEQAAIVTSEESRGVDFAFGPGVLRLAATAADVGSSTVELEVAHDGPPVEITFDPRYLVDALKTLDDEAPLTAELIDAKNAAVFRTEDGYSYVIMPLTRDR